MMQAIGSQRFGLGLFALACLAFGGCNSVGDAGSASLEQSMPNPAADTQARASPRSTRTLAPATAVAALPEDAGGVASVRGHGYIDGFRQDILLKGGAVRGLENGITVLAKTAKQATLDEATPLSKPTEAAIRSELGRTFPHLSMQVVDRQSSNAYGPYGLALGRAGGTIRCVYAWQWIDEGSLGKDTGLTGPVALRIRLCKPDTTFDALAAFVDHLTIRRDASAEVAAVTVTDPPAAAEPSPAPRKRLALRHAHRTRTASTRPEVGQQTSVAEPAPIVATPVAPQPLATDLPPQAYLGPSVRSSMSKPAR